MNDFNRFLVDNGLLMEAPTQPQVDPNTGQQIDPNTGLPIDPNQIQQQQQNPSQQNPNQPIDPNIDPSMMPDTETLQTPEFTNEEILARYNVITEFEVLKTVFNKIDVIKTYGLNIDIDGYRNTINEILTKIEVFTTQDLIGFKEDIKKKLLTDLQKINKENRKKLKEDCFDTLTKSEIELIEAVNYFDHFVEVKMDKDSYYRYVMALYSKKIKDLDEEGRIDVFGCKIDSKKLITLLKDSAIIFDRMFKKLKFDVSENLQLFDTPLYTKKQNITIVDSIKYVISSFPDDKGNKNYRFLYAPTSKTIIEFALMVRVMYIDCISWKDFKKNLKYADKIDDCYKMMVSNVIKKAFKEDNFYNKITELEKDGIDILNYDIDKYVLDPKVFNSHSIEVQNDIQKIHAARKYIEYTFNNPFKEFDNVFVNAYKDAFIEFDKLYVSELEHIVMLDSGRQKTIFTLLKALYFFLPLMITDYQK